VPINISLDHAGARFLYSFVCVYVCVCVCITALVGATSPLESKVRYQQKVLDVGNRLNVGIELKIQILDSKVMTVISLP